MEEQTAVAVMEQPEVAQVSVHRDLRLVAENPMQLAEEQRRLIAWCDGKIADLKAHRDELQSNLDAAKAHKWKTSTLASAVSRENSRIVYYEKMLAALQAGFFIVPNFDAEVFAVRTTRINPTFQSAQDRGRYTSQPWLRDVDVRAEEAGDGRHVSNRPNVNVIHDTVQTDKGESEKRISVRTVGFIDEIDFPFALAKPQVMNATQAAMALRIFDDIAVLPRSRRASADPMVVGVIRRKEGYNVKRCTFLIAWFLDTETL